MQGIRPLPLLAGALSALTVTVFAACGSGGSASEASERASEAQARAEAQSAKEVREYRRRKAAGEPTEEERRAEQAVAGFYEVLAAERGGVNRTTVDSGAFCDLMSEGAEKETVRYAKVASGIQKKWDCEAAVEHLVLRSKRRGGFKGVRNATVIGVNAEGNNATASVRFGDGVVTAVPLVREDGEWKLAASGFGR